MLIYITQYETIYSSETSIARGELGVPYSPDWKGKPIPCPLWWCLYGVPNSDVLLSPLTTQEAVFSSGIEGTQVTLGEVLRFEAGEEPEQESRRLDIHEIMNYRRALSHAEIALRKRQDWPHTHSHIPLWEKATFSSHVLSFCISWRTQGRVYCPPRALGHTDDAWNQWIGFFLTALDEQARQNTAKARAIMDLYENLKARVIELTHSLYALPLLDQMFERPFFQSTHLIFPAEPKPSRQMVASLLRTLRESGILKVIREGSGRRARILAFAELINLCEGKKVVWRGS